MLQHSGKLLVKVSGRSYERLTSGASRLQIAGYELESLFKSYQSTAEFSPQEPADNWFVANADSFDPTIHPWDLAHQAARAAGYLFYAEPDLLQQFMLPSSIAPTTGLNPHWPPSGPVSPGWHLLHGFTAFETVRDKAMGDGIRIAHLDTGYWPEHISTPKKIQPKLGWDFYLDQPSTVDPGTGGILNMPGHGTATMAFVAGNVVDLTFGGKKFRGYIGGAPSSDIVPVRIGPSVIHFYTRAMAQGIDYALAPRQNPNDKCDVVTISHGGLPAESWAAAVNHVYDAGIVVAAASGDNYNFIVDFPTNDTVWPSRFNRVITVVGATYDKLPYITDALGELQGNWGPEDVMKKAIASYTPNVAWMKFRTKKQYDMNGGGTSASTPQVAAACALWLQLYGARFTANWKRVEACRTALFEGAAPVDSSLEPYLGRGILYVPAMLDAARASQIEQRINAGKINPSPADGVGDPLWQELMQVGAAASEEDRMYEVEFTQIRHRSTNSELRKQLQEIAGGLTLSAASRARLRQMVTIEPDVSAALREKMLSLQ